MRAVARWLILAITISSWIALSNHCALSALAAKPQTTHTACPFHSKPAKSPPKSVECCKVLRALAASNAKQLAPAIVHLLNADRDGSQMRPAAPKVYFTATRLDTGPPGKTSFGELSWSMRAHAPPFRA